MSIARPRAVLAVALAMLGAVHVQGDAAAVRRDANALRDKVTAIQQQAAAPTPGRERRTTVTQDELNAFLALDAGQWIPGGVTDPTVTIVGAGRVAARAIVDLDAVRRQHARTGMFDPMNFLAGKLTLTAAGVLQAAQGSGRFELESATIAGVPIPGTVLQEIVTYYSRTPERPSGIVLADPFALPAGIRAVEVEAGRAIVVQ